MGEDGMKAKTGLVADLGVVVLEKMEVGEGQLEKMEVGENGGWCHFGENGGQGRAIVENGGRCNFDLGFHAIATD
ncbi:hypothetical protein SLEP1_g34591 [Rubroshorea leprosula]|uniref:Uncharacterized protein n=1 Tax=Rubroshorea leprosula TaxID=152421 RepID=A0AAV5KKF1_9ROSI|nr:hypothetical protein SLEP1_g34591 [Rubroshorea leprosula]